ncbi:hypothetical protein ACFSOZ_22890 [Mesorhizobium newzealandense]|uniref:Uncharacterized protein n=1 Tax=Mesorhizobium newzealandense TaxID=1300302 RepID=A0ABW4UFL8_9HYPH
MPREQMIERLEQALALVRIGSFLNESPFPYLVGKSASGNSSVLGTSTIYFNIR